MLAAHAPGNGRKVLLGPGGYGYGNIRQTVMIIHGVSHRCTTRTRTTLGDCLPSLPSPPIRWPRGTVARKYNLICRHPNMFSRHPHLFFLDPNLIGLHPICSLATQIFSLATIKWIWKHRGGETIYLWATLGPVSQPLSPTVVRTNSFLVAQGGQSRLAKAHRRRLISLQGSIDTIPGPEVIDLWHGGRAGWVSITETGWILMARTRLPMTPQSKCLRLTFQISFSPRAPPSLLTLLLVTLI